MRQLAFRRLGRLVVAVAGVATPSDAEWAEYLVLCTEMERDHGTFGATRALIFSDGGSPNGQQMVALGKLLKGQPAFTALICDSVLLRVANAVMSLINPYLRVFPSKDWRRGLAFADIEEAQVAEVLQVARALGRDVGRSRVIDSIPQDGP